MSNLDISDFTGSFFGEGARTNRFEVNVPYLANDRDFSFKCHASSLPKREVGTTEMNFHGRKHRTPTVSTYDTWDVKVYMDADFQVRRDFEDWLEELQSRTTTESGAWAGGANATSNIALVKSLDQNDNVKRTWTFNGLFPTTIGDISLDWANEDVMTFNVTFRFNYFTAE